MLRNSVSYTQIYESFAEESRHLAELVNEGGIAWSRGWFEAEDGSDIFCEITLFETDLIFQVGPVLYPDGTLNSDEWAQVDSLERAAKVLYEGLTYREVDILF